MKWSWKLGRFAGVDVYVHATFLLLVGFIAISSYFAEGSLAAAVLSVVYILALFASVLLHEYGHALAARRYRIQTRDITLYPIGGVARLERMPEKPLQELWVALAGPAVNAAIAAVLFAGLLVTSGLPSLNELSLVEGPLLVRLMIVNLWLVVFNLIPAFPMDGGRVLRALLATRLEYTQATQVAAGLGQGIALLFGLAGLFGNPFLVFIAFFVWTAASQEASMVQMKSALGGIPVHRAMITHFRTVSQHDPLQRAVDMILDGSQEDFPVDEEGRIIGVLTRQDLLGALAKRGQAARVADVMQRDFETADPSEMLESVFARMQSVQCHTVPVVSQGRLVGMVTMDNVGEFLLIQASLEARRKASLSPTGAM